MDFVLPFGQGQLIVTLPDGLNAEVVKPVEVAVTEDPIAAVEAALDAPVGGVDLESWRGARSAAIAINDKTRPVPQKYLLPPLLHRLEELGLAPEDIQILIACGTHPLMPPEDYHRVVSEEVLARYPVLCHDADDREGLAHRGATSQGTPVWINRRFLEADLRIAVGNIEPHQFQGFSGGVKSVAVGLAGRDLVLHNHAMMSDPRTRLGRYADNPARQDLEEIGEIIGVHLVLNSILNGQKQIVHVLAGEPQAVMEAGVPLSRSVSQVAVGAAYDLVIASPGGHPKDINLYQSQKAVAHASQVTRDGGALILVAACPEDVGSPSYEEAMEGMGSHEEVLDRFAREPFRIGPHKAFLMSRDAVRVQIVLVSEMDPAAVRRLLLTPARSIDEALDLVLASLPSGARVGILPRASSTIPYVG